VYRSQINSERGSALVATTVVSLLLLSVLVWHLSQARLMAKVQTHEHATEYALHYAESGLLLAEQALQVPSVLATTGTVTGSLGMPNGRCFYTLVRSSTTTANPLIDDPFQPVLVDATSTGYYYLDKGQSTDPVNGRTVQAAVMRAKLNFRAIGLFPAASPGRLRINDGTSVMFGPVYARELIFERAPDASNPPGVIEEAFFGDSVRGDEARVETAPRAIGVTPHFPAMGGKIRSYYQTLAQGDKSRLDSGATLQGRTKPPEDTLFPIYYCHGDLNIGSSEEFEPVGPLLIYVEGNLVIHRSIRGSGDSWVAFLVEKDILLDISEPIGAFELKGNFISNGALRWRGPPPDPQRFSFVLTGSLLAGRGFDSTTVGLEKKFMRWQVDDVVLPLPRFTQMLESQILVGKYRH
jgi:hypothetical protein